MKTLLRTLRRALWGLMLLCALSSCGAVVGFGVVLDDDDGYYGYDSNHFLYNGLWRGDYVYWQGDWHYRGFGTPYDDDYYYPYWW